MIRFFLIASLLVISFSHGICCEINLQRFLYLSSINQQTSDIFRDCGRDIQDFTTAIFKSNDDVSHEFLRSALASEGYVASIHSSSSKTSVVDIEKLIKQKFSSSNFKIEKLTTPIGLPASTQTIPEIICENCNRLGQTTFKINTAGRVYYGEIHLGTTITAYFTKENLVQGEVLSESALEKRLFITSRPELYLTDSERLKFARITQNVSANSPLLKSTLLPENIISPFKSITLMIESEGLIIRGIGISQGSGAYGDSVAVKVGNNQKIVNAKVIGRDLARIQL